MDKLDDIRMLCKLNGGVHAADHYDIEWLISEVERLREICRRIEEHDHLDPECREQCGDSFIGDEQYDIGTIAGHRCCAAIAAEARKK
jgi:hypothetical protein